MRPETHRRPEPARVDRRLGGYANTGSFLAGLGVSLVAALMVRTAEHGEGRGSRELSRERSDDLQVTNVGGWLLK